MNTAQELNALTQKMLRGEITQERYEFLMATFATTYDLPTFHVKHTSEETGHASSETQGSDTKDLLDHTESFNLATLLRRLQEFRHESRRAFRSDVHGLATRTQLQAASRGARTTRLRAAVASLAALAMVACGTELPTEDDLKAEEPVTREVASPSVSPASGTRVEVEVSVDVTTSTYADGQAAAYLYYDPRPVAWDFAISSARPGYALASRLDILELQESGELWDYVPADAIIWTNSLTSNGMIWAFEAKTGYFWKMVEVSRYTALYYKLDDFTPPVAMAGSL